MDKMLEVFLTKNNNPCYNLFVNIVLVLIVGAILGIATPKFLYLGPLFSLPPWGLIGLVNGVYAKTKKDALTTGVVYGFVFSFIFIILGYADGGVLILTRVPLVVIIGAFGPFYGAVLGLIGYLLKRLLKSSKK